MSGAAEHALPAWLGALEGALEANARAALVLVAHVTGSVPRESGAAMVVTQSAPTVPSVSTTRSSSKPGIEPLLGALTANRRPRSLTIESTTSSAKSSS